MWEKRLRHETGEKDRKGEGSRKKALGLKKRESEIQKLTFEKESKEEDRK